MPQPSAPRGRSPGANRKGLQLKLQTAELNIKGSEAPAPPAVTSPATSRSRSESPYRYISARGDREWDEKLLNILQGTKRRLNQLLQHTSTATPSADNNTPGHVLLKNFVMNYIMVRCSNEH